ncbi:MAG: hypothetical protein LLG13_02510 [Bacteroidales bacterium]|nr:hypothetical protein [Bacteroidales bacterium]
MPYYNKHKIILIFCLLALILQAFTCFSAEGNLPNENTPAGLRLSTFDVDATPPVGSQLAYDLMVNSWDMGLRARGIVLLGSGQPIVLCAVDWIGISNDSQDAFKIALAEAAGTVPERVAVHTVHPHDAPISDFGAERLLKEAGLNPISYESSFQREVIRRLAIAVKNSLEKAQPITHIGLGEAKVYEVASNRRILGPDGKVIASRSSSCRDSALRAEPEGLIDPMVSLVSFWNANQPVAVLSYYACHPQSYYRLGIANPDFPGVARFMRQLAVPEALHVHFNGAGGNVAAGKYNDGSKERRGELAGRLADGMKRAWEATRKEPVTANDVEWNFEPVALPPASFIENLQEEMKTKDQVYLTNNLFKLVWLRRLQAGKKINVNCLSLGKARILFMPGELFVEFQLAAKKMRPDLFVAMAAYGDYATGYICTDKAYNEGGYEAGIASAVTPGAEAIILASMRKLLQSKK